MSLMSLTAAELGRKIKSGEVTAVQAAQEALDAIAAKETAVNSFVTVVDRDKVLAQAENVQKQIEAGEYADSPLAGVPVAIKDNMCIEGILTTCSSKILNNFYPTYTAEAVLNLQKAGAVIIGKTNMDEFAMGSTTETSAYGETKILGIQSMCREVRPVVLVPLLQRRSALLPSVQIPADLFASHLPSVA